MEYYMSYFGRETLGEAISFGRYSSITKWSKIGYCPIGATTESDIWSYGGTTAIIPKIVTAATMRVMTNSAADAATTLFGPTNADGAAGANKTSLVDADVNFSTAEVGDIIILDKSGTTPAWGYVSDVTNKATGTLLTEGFSDGGGSGGRSYIILNQNVATKVGAQAVYIGGLDANYNQQSEICLTAGGTPGYTATIKTWYRINEFRVISVGTGLKSAGAIALADAAGTPATVFYSYITAGFNRARNSQYTIPAGKTLWVTAWNVGFGFTGASAKPDYCRVYTRANQYSSPDNAINFKTRQSSGVDMWYPYSEVMLSQGTQSIVYEEPTKLLEKVTLKVTGYASSAGFVTSVLRGYIVTP
jgi:hypothetical protein